MGPPPGKTGDIKESLVNPQTLTTETLSGAQLVVRLLERQGVNTVAGLPGGAILPIYDALAQSPSIR